MTEGEKPPKLSASRGYLTSQVGFGGLQEMIRQAAAIGETAFRMPQMNLPAIRVPALYMELNFPKPIVPDLPGLTAMLESQKAFTDHFERITRAIRFPLIRFPALDGLMVVLRREQRLDGLGWLPHASAPWEEIDAADDADIAAILERHYREEWPAVRRTFEVQLASYAIDDEAKATFREALDAHEAGLYRTTTRTLFPEIERVSRIELHDGSTRSFASQKELQEWAMELVPGDVAPPGRGGWELIKRLIEHLYVKVEAPEVLEAIRVDPVPNRHAAVHGLVTYPTMQNSINALIMTDFVFVVICAVKRYRETETALA